MITKAALFSSVATMFVIANPAMAQQQPVAQGSTSASTSAGTVDDGVPDIVVTAQRRSESSSKVPVSIVAFGAEQIAQRSITTERDLQASVPGLVIKTTSSESQLSYAIRAQTVEPYSGVSPAVLGYINEVEANSSASGSFYDLSSVQVLKGPQGTLFGRNTTGGAILYTTTLPGDEPGGYFTQRFGNLGMVESQGAVDVPISDAVRLRIAGDYYTRKGYQLNLLTRQKLGGSTRGSGRGTLVLRPTDRIENRTVFEYSSSDGNPTINTLYSYNTCGAPGLNSSAVCLYSPALDAIFNFPGAWDAYLAAHPNAYPDGIVGAFNRQQQIGPRKVVSPQQSNFDASSWYVNNTTTFELSGTMRLKNIFGYSKSRSHFSTDQQGTPFTIQVVNRDPVNGIQGNNFRQRNITEELQLSGETDSLKYVVGFYYSDAVHYEDAAASFFDLAPIAPADVTTFVFRTKSEVKAGYGQATYDLSSATGLEGLKLTGGFRYTWERNTLYYPNVPHTVFGGSPTESALFQKPSWQVGLDYQATPGLLLYVVSRGSWRSGGFNGFAASNPTLAADGGGNKFLPETTKDVEVGAKYRGNAIGFPMSLDVALYSQWIDNVLKQASVTIGGTPTALTVNVPKARVRGVEVSATFRPVPAFELGFNGAFTDPVYTNGRAFVLGGGFNNFGPFADVARWSGSAYMQVQLPTPASWGEMSLRGDVYGQTSQYFSNLNNTITPGTKLPGYSLLNLRLDWREVMGSQITLSAFAKNVTDKTYFTGGFAAGAAFGTNSARAAEPRTFGGELTLKF